jgi:cyclophilin family peptidyl-prolyl cis-trans isomerase
VSKAAKRERQRQNREAAKAAQAQAAKRQRLMRSLRSFGIVAVVVIAGVAIFSFITSNDSESTSSKYIYSAPPKMTIDPNKQYSATIDTSEGTIVVALDPKTAPIATNNFVFLARQRYYDGTTIERAAKNFVIQGGDRGKEPPGYTVKGEVPTDGYPLGSLAAAKSGAEAPGTFGSTFFIVTGTGTTLPNDYARWGSVTSGLDVAQKIESFAPTSGDGPPTTNVKIKKVTITETDPSTSTSATTPATTP